MSSPKENGTIIILDIGRNVSMPVDKNGKSFFDDAKECAARILERKIMSLGKNLVGVILLGSQKTINNMEEHCKGGFRHIEVLAELSPPSWEVIRNLPKTPSAKRGDWISALVVAADHFKNGASILKNSDMKILLMTNFQSHTTFSSKDVQQILNGFKEDNYEVDVIGPDLYDENFKGDDVEFARMFVEGTNGATATFDYAMRYLLFHKTKAANPRPWNIDLSIGPNIKIPVSAYIRLRDDPIVNKWMKAVKDPVTTKASTSKAVVKNKVHVNTENQSVVEESEIIKGYHYGQKVIPFSDCDKTMLYEPGTKCLSVYGFTHASNISWQSLNGSGISYVFGRKGDKKAQYTVRCLVECLHELNLAGIVRRVYNNNSAPKMFTLMPVIDTNNFVCLSMIELCFKEDIKYMSFPPTSLKKYACSDEQVDAFKNLIKAMDLTKAYDESFDDTEAFPIAETVSPFAQYVLDCIAFRALNPDKPLPQPRDDIMNLFKVPPVIEKRSREPLEKLKKLFTLNKVEKKVKNVNTIEIDEPLIQPSTNADNEQEHDMPKVNLPLPTLKNDVYRISTLDPVGDFVILSNKGKTLADLIPEMTKAIENLFYHNLDGNYTKAFDAMIHVRGECVKTDPGPYNNWLQKFKVGLNDRKKNDIVIMISEKNVNYILKHENNLSTFDTEDSHEESQLYENDTIPNSTDLTIQTEVNDMFDEM